DLFKNDAGFGDAETGAAVFFRNQRRQPAEFRKLTYKGLGIVFLAVHLTPIGVRKFTTNFANLIADLKLILAQVEIHWRLLYLAPSRELKAVLAGCSKRLRGEAREKSTSRGVLTRTLERGD